MKKSASPGSASEQHWHELARCIQIHLQKLHVVESSVNICDFLVSEDEFKEREALNPRGQVLLKEHSEDVEIAVVISEDIKEQLVAQDPRKLLSLKNLDAFTVVIEEISHFHMLCHRASIHQPLTPLEMELQAEFDKVVLCTQWLYKQSGDEHLVPLLRLLFDQSLFLNQSNIEIYRESSRLIANFLFRLADKKTNSPSLQNERAQEFIKEFFRASMQKKRHLLRAA